MKYSIGTIIGALALGAAGAAAGDKVEQSLDLQGFERIDVSGVYEVDVQVGPDFSIVLTGEEKEMASSNVSVKQGTLHLAMKKQDNRWRRKNSESGVHAIITMPYLDGLSVSGVTDLEIVNVNADNVDIEVSGVGEVDIAGECGRLEAALSGVGKLNAKELLCRAVVVNLSGVGEATVFAEEEVDAKVSGIGGVHVYGSPERVSRQSGMFATIEIH